MGTGAHEIEPLVGDGAAVVTFGAKVVFVALGVIVVVVFGALVVVFVALGTSVGATVVTFG